MNLDEAWRRSVGTSSVRLMPMNSAWSWDNIPSLSSPSSPTPHQKEERKKKTHCLQGWHCFLHRVSGGVTGKKKNPPGQILLQSKIGVHRFYSGNAILFPKTSQATPDLLPSCKICPAKFYSWVNFAHTDFTIPPKSYVSFIAEGVEKAFKPCSKSVAQSSYYVTSLFSGNKYQ